MEPTASDDGPRRDREEAAGDRRRTRRRRARQERVLHTRISEPLAEEIRRIAEDLRVPVSNLVRNVLEEAFTVVESVTDNVGDWIEDVVEEADRVRSRARDRRPSESAHDPEPDRAAPPSYPQVIGWQPLIYNQRTGCADCGASIEAGERGYLGLGSAGPTGIHLCAECVSARR